MRHSPVVIVLATLMAAQPAARPHARDLGISPGVAQPGPLNAITDVAGVKVGHITLIEGDDVRTGVTAIIPGGGNLFQEKLAGAVFGLARTGSSYSNGSGDFAIAFSTANRVKQNGNRPATYEALGTDAVSPLFDMALEATEEAVDNSLLQATTVKSKFGTAEAIPIDRLRELLKLR